MAAKRKLIVRTTSNKNKKTRKPRKLKTYPQAVKLSERSIGIILAKGSRTIRLPRYKAKAFANYLKKMSSWMKD